MGRDTELERRNRKRLFMGILFSALYYVVLWFTVNMSGRIEGIMIGDFMVTMVIVRCFMMLIQILLAVLLVIAVRKRGMMIATALLIISGGTTAISLHFSHIPDTVNGVTMAVFGLIITFVVYFFIRKVENNEIKMNTMLNTDELTGLPNRHALFETLRYKVERNERFALLQIDVDNFKTVNDTVGHKKGDELLQKFVKQWEQFPSREDDFFARSGGDEFVLLVSLKDCNKEEVVKAVEQSVYGATFDHDYVVDDVHFFITASIGIAFYPDDADTSDKLMQYADMALYMAKDTGKQSVCVFDQTFVDSMNDSVNIENFIRMALEKDMFFLNYQPQYNVSERKLRGFETLVRMDSGDGKVISPGVFIPIAEKTLLITQIDKWVFKHALEQFLPMISLNPELILSVNVSVKYLFHDSFLSDVKACLKTTSFPPENLEIEITESVFITSVDRAIETLHQIKDLGIHIALDDFGTGYASLSYVNSLPIDLLKIDKTFIDQLSDEKENNEFVEAIINMGHTLNLQVVSEGVEKEQQVTLLDNYKCDYIQGYLWGKPMPFDNVKELVARESMKG